jgi:hypothetical protein
MAHPRAAGQGPGLVVRAFAGHQELDPVQCRVGRGGQCHAGPRPERRAACVGYGLAITDVGPGVPPRRMITPTL